MSAIEWPSPVSTHDDSEEQLLRDADWHLGPIPAYRVVARAEPHVPEPPLPMPRRGEHSQTRGRAPKPAPKPRGRKKWQWLTEEKKRQIAAELRHAPRKGLTKRGGAVYTLADRYGISPSTVYTIAREVAGAEDARKASRPSARREAV